MLMPDGLPVRRFASLPAHSSYKVTVGLANVVKERSDPQVKQELRFILHPEEVAPTPQQPP
jgi:hypothetical protein